jgi:hypothetical protein
MQPSTSRIMICEFVYKQTSYYSSRSISDSWTNQREKFCLITAILTSSELITTAKEECLKISWKRSTLTLNTRTNESRIRLSESSIIIAIYSKTFNSENMTCMTLLSLKCQSSQLCRSRLHQLSLLTRTHKENILKMSEKMSDINRSVNQLINQSQLRSIRSVNQLINRNQSFEHRHQSFILHSGNFNHSTLNHYTIHSTLQSISHITSTINHHTNQSISMHQSISTRPPSHFGHRTQAIKFGSFRKHLNRIYLNQLNHLHSHRNHLHLHSHQHLNSHQNQFSSINRTSRMIDSDNWHYWIKSIRRMKNSATRTAILTLKCWNFMINVDVRNYSSTRICRMSWSCLQTRHLTITIQICNFAIHFMSLAST